MASKAYKAQQLWERLMRFTNRVPAPEGLPGDCYLYTGPTSGWKGGLYGKLTIRINGKPTGVGTHRLAYETFVKKLAPGFEAGHKCHRSLCWNPEHIRGIGHKQNIKERDERRKTV